MIGITIRPPSSGGSDAVIAAKAIISILNPIPINIYLEYFIIVSFCKSLFFSDIKIYANIKKGDAKRITNEKIIIIPEKNPSTKSLLS